MARITDQKKIERLKQSTMKLVVERGFGGASATLIAKDARVASGYFYMHYKGKYEMVDSLLQEVFQELVTRFTELLAEGHSFSEIIETMIRFFFGMANSEPIKVKFLYVLTNDYSFVIDKDIKENTYSIIRKLKEMGYASAELDREITEDDLFLILFMNTIQFINQRYKNAPKISRFIKKDEDHLLYLINKMLK
ncbi:transcriptional regulator, TetR family [Mariniphaga anaerophila]|uniref:Transcriptional regulator, TetR family n=2 Tax=Mariniphaga anaerophila TaxID=1484053 RepID=A0A1M5AEQ7_9BACT|nr:transcriptional regulator, TetR family [Mariniphaga anaerophila]